MGMRALIKIADTGVVLYTHWGSGYVIDDVTRAIKIANNDGRLNDPGYFTRIVFDNLHGRSLQDTTGFGIDTEIASDAEIVISVSLRGKNIAILDVYENETRVMSFDEILTK